MIEKKHLSMFIVLMLLASLAMISAPVQSPPAPAPSPVTYAVEMPPEGYIPGVKPTKIFEVNVTIDASSLTTNSTEGIVGWNIDVQVNPDVLEVMGAKGAGTPGHFIYEFLDEYYPTGYNDDFIIGPVNKAEGYIDEISELISPTPPTGAGGTGILCRLGFRSKSNTTYSPIKISIYEDGVWQPVFKNATEQFTNATVIDGHYCSLPPNAELVRKSAWPEHHHFGIAKDEDFNGTHANQTLFGKVRNLGDMDVLVKVVFEVKGPKPLPLLETANKSLIPGEIFDLTVNVPFEDADVGLYRCLAYAMYYTGVDWELGAKTKATKFTVVP